jgi:hypothetical protein
MDGRIGRSSWSRPPKTRRRFRLQPAMPATQAGKQSLIRAGRTVDRAGRVAVLCCCTRRTKSSNFASYLWSYGDSNPGPLACHQQAARPLQYVCAGHRPRKCAPVPSGPHRLRYFLAVPASLPGQAPHERLTSQNRQELYRGAPQGDQHPIAPDECRKAPEAVPGSGHDHCLSPTAASPRSELPATAEPFGRQSQAGHGRTPGSSR